MRLRLGWLFSFFCNFGIVLFYFTHGSRRFATHFDMNGNADGFLLGRDYAFISLFVLILINGLLIVLSYFADHPSMMQLTNIPNKSAWIQSGRFVSRLRAFLSVVGMWVNVLLLVSSVFIVRANLRTSVPQMEEGFGYFVMAMVAALILFVFTFFRVKTNSKMTRDLA